MRSSLWSSRAVSRWRVLLPLAAAALALAGCGGAPATGASGTDLPGSPIAIGAIVNVTGPGSLPEKYTPDVLQAWADHVNDTGGINGHPVEIRVEDTRGDAPTASSIAENFLADDSVVAVLMASSSTEGAVGPTLAAGDVAVGGIGYNPQVWSALPNFYTTATTFPALVDVQVASATAVGARSIAAFACAENPNCLAAKPVLEAAVGRAGVTFVGSLQVAASAPNYTAECLRLRDQAVEFAQLSVAEDVGTRVVADCQRQGYQGWFGASSASVTSGLYGIPGIRLTGGVNGFPWWVDSAPVKNYRDVMVQQGVEEPAFSNPASTGVWASAELLRTALAAIDPNAEVTRQTVQDGYGALKDEDLDGLLPMPVTYTAGQPAPQVPCYWLYTYQDGAFTGGDQPTCDTAS